MNQSYRSELISQNAQVICHLCKKPIASRKEFAMGVVKFGTRLQPIHIHCWAEFWAIASLGQKFLLNPTIKLTANTEKAMKQSRIVIAAIFGFAGFAGLVAAVPLAVETGKIVNSFLLLLAAGIYVGLIAGLDALLTWTVYKQDKQWNKCIAMIPEEEAA